ncbi:leucyl aminopeptidase [Candidatus Margulisiibacteriota bacterium]
MKIFSKKYDLNKIKEDGLILTLYKNEKQLNTILKIIDIQLNKKITQLKKEGIIQGKRGEMTVIYGFGNCKINKIIIAGLGKKGKANYDTFRSVYGELGRKIEKEKIKSTIIEIPEFDNTEFEKDKVIQAITEGLILGSYEFKELKTRQKKEPNFEIKNICLNSNTNDKKSIEKAIITANAVNLARDLANMPSNIIYPLTFIEKAKKVLKGKKNIKLNIIDKKQAQKLKMNAFLGVGKGSDHDPYLLEITYKANKKSKDNPYIIGKGVTFDSGGISIKPASGMEEMKGDMSGAANVLAVMTAIADLQPNINITALAPLVENMPSGKALKPGDVVVAMNGKTVEIINTDAEGRLILIDAMCYAVKNKATQIIDIATLTGACSVALGDIASAIIGNKQEIIDKFIKVTEFTGEKLWQLPLYEEYIRYLKSDTADIANCSKKRLAGTATAAKFLEQFVNKTPWAHIDIASTADHDKTEGYLIKGMTGTGVRNLLGYLLK